MVCFTLPNTLHHFELLVEQLATAVIVDAAGPEIVLTPADTEPEPATGEVVERPNLLRKQGRVGMEWFKQDVGAEANPVSDCGSGGEGDQWLVVRIDQPVD